MNEIGFNPTRTGWTGVNLTGTNEAEAKDAEAWKAYAGTNPFWNGEG